MATTSTWSDEKSNGSYEEENMVSNQVIFSGTLVSGNSMLMQRRSGSVATYVVCMSVKSNTVATYRKMVAISLCGSNSDSGDESKNNDESLQEVYTKGS